MRAVLATLFLATAVLAGSEKTSNRKIVKGSYEKSPRLTAAMTAKAAKVGALKGTYECDGCITFADDSLNALIKALVGGIPASCGDLCSIALGTGIAGEVCDVLCTVVGLDEFVNILSTADISPVWFCMEVDACPTTTCTSNCVSTRNIVVTPTSAGPPGVFNVDYYLFFAAGVGTVSVDFEFGNEKFGYWDVDQDLLIIAPPAGEGIKIQLASHLEVEPGMGFPPECPSPGAYNTTAYVCLGVCGDTFNISGPILSQASGPFVNVTEGDGCKKKADAAPRLRFHRH